MNELRSTEPVTQDLAGGIAKQYAAEMERSLVAMATVLLRKTDRRVLRITHEDLRKALEAGPATVETQDDGRTVIYKLPSKKQKGVDAP